MVVGQDLIDAAKGLPPTEGWPGELVEDGFRPVAGDLVAQSGQKAGLPAKLDTARQALGQVRESLGLTLPIEVRAKQIRCMDQGAAMAVAGGLDDLGREFKRTSVDLKRLIAPEPKPAGRPKKGEEISSSDNEIFSENQLRRQRELKQVPDEVVDRVFAEAAERGDVPSEREIIEAAKPKTSKYTGDSSNEHYTPVRIIDAARDVMGGIDLDPASCETAQVRIQAATWYGAKDDGLSQTWHGRIWLNPPFSNRDLDNWVGKLVRHVEAGDVPEACLLLHASTDTKYGQTAISHSAAVCFHAGRIKFEGPSAGKGGAQIGQMICYYGANEDRFAEAFEELGNVVWGRGLDQARAQGRGRGEGRRERTVIGCPRCGEVLDDSAGEDDGAVCEASAVEDL